MFKNLLLLLVLFSFCRKQQQRKNRNSKTKQKSTQRMKRCSVCVSDFLWGDNISFHSAQRCSCEQSHRLKNLALLMTGTRNNSRVTGGLSVNTHTSALGFTSSHCSWLLQVRKTVAGRSFEVEINLYSHAFTFFTWSGHLLLFEFNTWFLYFHTSVSHVGHAV